MARIPMGDFGNVVARPGPQVQVSPESHGAAVGRALQQAGQIGMAEAGRDIAIGQAEAKQQAREAAAEAKAAAREAARVKALTTQASIGNGLADLQDEIDKGIADGSVDKTKAAEIYTTRSQKILDEGIKGVDPEHQELVRATVLTTVNRGRASVTKAVAARDRADIMAGGLSYIEEMQRFAARGPAEADQAIANVRSFWTATGPQAGEDPAQASKRVQQFAERVRFNQAAGLVNTDPAAALKALKDPAYLPELDPANRTNLIHTADARVTQAANRAEIQARARERLLEREWTAVSTVLDAGKTLDPAFAAEVMRKFKGTSYEKALGSLMAEGPANAAFAGQPLPMQQRALEEMQGKMNREGATPAQVKAYQKAEKAHKAAVEDLKADPYMAAAERGVLRELSPLSLDLNTLPQQLAQRSQDAATVSQWAGQEVSLFRPGEVDKLAPVIQALPPQDRAVTMQTLAKNMTPGQMRAFAQQLGAKDDTLAAAAILSAQGAKTTAGRLASEIVLTGADAMKEQRIKWPSGQDQTTVRQEIDQLTRGAFLSEAAQRAAGDAALAAYAGLLAEGKTPSAKDAVKLVTGGVMEMGGQKIIKPWGWTDDRVRAGLREFNAERLSSLTGGQPVRLGDKALGAADLAKLMPGAQLGPSPKPGAYTISFGGRMVMAADGRPLIVPLEQR